MAILFRSLGNSNLMFYAVLISFALLPRVDASGEIALDLGTEDDLRGTIQFAVDLDLFAGNSLFLTHRPWRFSIAAQAQSFVRENRRKEESAWRISPDQIHYPVMGAFRFEIADLDENRPLELGIFAAHQSNHDIDSKDAFLAHETLSYELYGLEALQTLHRGFGRLFAALHIDRGTRLDQHLQDPFDFGYFALGFEGSYTIWRGFYAALDLFCLRHRADENWPRNWDLDGTFDLGWRFNGTDGFAKLFLRGAREEAYQYVGDEPVLWLLAGVELGRGR